MIQAQLADGRILEFPDGTDPNVIQTTVKKMVSGGQKGIPLQQAIEGVQSGGIDPQLEQAPYRGAHTLSDLARRLAPMKHTKMPIIIIGLILILARAYL